MNEVLNLNITVCFSKSFTMPLAHLHYNYLKLVRKGSGFPCSISPSC